MEYTKGNIGRVFIVRIDNKENLIEELENLATYEDIRSAVFVLLGAVDEANLVTGPLEKIIPPEPVWSKLEKPSEIMGIGNIFFENEKPKVHLHTSTGNQEDVKVGCLRGENETFMVIEVFIMELSGISAARVFDSNKGFAPIQFNNNQ
jgi:hypothetical protein